MKQLLGILAVIFIVFIGFNHISPAKTQKTQENIMTNKKVLVAYFSYSGNTKAVAEKIQKLTGGDILEIILENPYPTGYNEVVAQAKKEKAENFMPELKTETQDLSKYDMIFVGTPVWWYTMAAPVKTFLTKNNFEGKVIAPFCTHGGGGASSTYSDMQKLAPQAIILDGYTSYEKTADEKSIENWIKHFEI